MKRFLTTFSFVALLILSAASVWAQNVTISSSTRSNFNYVAGATTAKLRIWAHPTFFAADGTQILGGQDGNASSVYKEVACTVSSGVVTIPSFSLYSTTDSLDVATATYSAFLYDQNGTRRDLILGNFRLPLSLAPTTTWAAIRVWNAGQPIQPRPSFWNNDQVQAAINLAMGSLNYAGFGTLGRTQLSVAPASPTIPIARGINDTTTPILAPVYDSGSAVFNVKAFGAACDRVGTSGTNDRVAVQAAITAAEAAGGGTVLIPGQCLVGTASASSYVLTIAKSIKLKGVGGALPGLFFTTDTPTSTHMLRYLPTTFPYNEGLTIEDMTFGTAGSIEATGNWTCSPCSGGDILVIDSSAVSPSSSYIRGMHVSDSRFLKVSTSTGHYGIRATGTNLNGTPGKSRFSNLLIYDGISMPEAGDSIVFENIQLIGDNSMSILQVAGAAGLDIKDLNATLKGGVALSGVHPVLSGTNYIELYVAGSTGTNGAVLSVVNSTQPVLHGLTLGSLASVTLNGIYLSASTNPDIDTLYYNVPSGKFGLDVSANNNTHFVGRTTAGGVGTLNDTTYNSRIQMKASIFKAMPIAGQGNTGSIANIGDARLIGETGRGVTMNLDNRDTTLFSQYRFEEAGTAAAAINQIGSVHATSARRNNLEFLNLHSTADLTFGAGTGAERWRVKGTGGHLEAQSAGVHINQSAANSDIAGSISLSAATSGSKTFTTAYASAPKCSLTPEFNLAGADFWVTTSTTAVTANTSGAVTGAFTYQCKGNPN